MKKRGRPSSGRTEYLEVRLTIEEKRAFENAAQAKGLSISDWVRQNLRSILNVAHVSEGGLTLQDMIDGYEDSRRRHD